jgi:cold shock CspA family protein
MAELTGHVSRIGPKFGFVRCAEVPGEVFLSLSELPPRAEVRVGDEVRFELEEGSKGLRAVRVRLEPSAVFARQAAAVLERARHELEELARLHGVAV